jgi:hypothetical protein
VWHLLPLHVWSGSSARMPYCIISMVLCAEMCCLLLMLACHCAVQPAWQLRLSLFTLADHPHDAILLWLLVCR